MRPASVRPLRSRWALAVLVVALGVVPLGLLSYIVVERATSAVRNEAHRSLSSTASLTAVFVSEQMRGFGDLTDAYARRPALRAALEDPRSYDLRELDRQMRELRHIRPGIKAAGFLDPSGRMVALPAAPDLVGKDFSKRDYYHSVIASGHTDVGAAIYSAIDNTPVVPVASPVRDGRQRLIGIVVIGYRLGAIQAFVERFVRNQGIAITLTDQHGVIIAQPRGRSPRVLTAQTDDPRVREALAGRSGVSEGQKSAEGKAVLSAFAPVRKIGWTVVAELPRARAYAQVATLERTVILIGVPLALLFVAGGLLLARVLRARDRARERAERLSAITRAMLDTTPDAIGMFDPEGDLVLENSELTELWKGLGLEEGEPLGGNVTKVAGMTEDPERYLAEMQELAADPDRVASFDYEIAGRTTHLYTAPVRDGKDAVLGRLFVLRDVTAERQAERLKTNLVATVSHELRTPLAGILGYAELLSSREYDEETRRRYLGIIRSQANRLTALITDFLDLQRLEEGSFTLALEPFDLSDLLREEAELYSAQSAVHTIDLSEGDGPVVVMGERARIAQVIGNLLSNAIKYSPEGGRVTARIDSPDGAVRVSITDSGLGVPKDQRPRMFQRFSRIERSDQSKIGGTGLGLALCREIVEAHGGRIDFESVEGEGSTFWFELPLSEGRDEAREPYVLVVEDDRDISSLIADCVREEGLAAEIVRTGEEALALVRRDPVVLLCLDARLAGEVDGWDVLAELKGSGATASIPVILCSGSPGSDPQRAATFGAADFLVKPFSPEQLTALIQRLLPTNRGSVLIVDDEQELRTLVRETLADLGLDLREASDGQQALEMIADWKPDAIILDLLMPVLDGFGVIERLQVDPQTRSIPIVVLTGVSLSAEERTLLQTKTASLLSKSSYSAAELRRLIRQAAGRSGI